jgi:hypothetical protein
MFHWVTFLRLAVGCILLAPSHKEKVKPRKSLLYRVYVKYIFDDDEMDEQFF